MPSQQKKRIRNKKNKNQLQNEIVAELHDDSSDTWCCRVCNHEFDNEYLRTWYDNKFTRAISEAVKLTDSVTVYYDDDGVLKCPTCDTVYTCGGSDLKLLKVIGKLYFRLMPCGRQPTIYITSRGDVEQMFDSIMTAVLMMKIQVENKFEHYIMDSGSHMYLSVPACIGQFRDSKPLLLQDAHKYIHKLAKNKSTQKTEIIRFDG